MRSPWLIIQAFLMTAQRSPHVFLSFGAGLQWSGDVVAYEEGQDEIDGPKRCREDSHSSPVSTWHGWTKQEILKIKNDDSVGCYWKFPGKCHVMLAWGFLRYLFLRKAGISDQHSEQTLQQKSALVSGETSPIFLMEVHHPNWWS